MGGGGRIGDEVAEPWGVSSVDCCRMRPERRLRTIRPRRSVDEDGIVLVMRRMGRTVQRFTDQASFTSLLVQYPLRLFKKSRTKKRN